MECEVMTQIGLDSLGRLSSVRVQKRLLTLFAKCTVTLVTCYSEGLPQHQHTRLSSLRWCLLINKVNLKQFLVLSSFCRFFLLYLTMLILITAYGKMTEASMSALTPCSHFHTVHLFTYRYKQSSIIFIS